MSALCNKMLTLSTKSETLLSNFFYDGARADMVKTLSVNPIFQVTHAFSMGATSAQGPVPPSYNFGAVYGSDKVRLPLTLLSVSKWQRATY